MKKPIIALIVLAVIASASIGAFLVVKNKNDKETQQEQEKIADNVLFSMDDVTKLELNFESGTYIAEIVDNVWTLTSAPDSEDFILNQDKLSSIASYMANLTAQTSYGEATDDKKTLYGLDNPFVITASDSNSTQTLYIGNLSPTGDYYYAMTDNKDNIYAIAYNDAVEIITEKMSIKDSYLIPYSDNEVIGMELQKDDKTVFSLSLNTETGVWELPEEYSLLTINHTVPSNILTLITRLEAVEMLEENPQDLSAYGFDNPTARFIVKGYDGTERSMLLSNYGDDPTYIYVLLEDSKQVELYYSADFTFIDYNVIDLVMNKIEGYNIYTINEFSFECESINETFTVNANEGTAEINGNEIDLSNAEIFGFFQNFYNSFTYMFISDIDVESKPELIDPIMTANYKTNTGEEQTVQLVQSETDGQAYVFIDGKYTGSLTSTDFIYGKDSCISKYETFCEHAGL